MFASGLSDALVQPLLGIGVIVWLVCRLLKSNTVVGKAAKEAASNKAADLIRRILK